MLAKEIKVRRAILDMNQSQLAERAKVSPQSVSTYETGYAKPTVDGLISLAAALECSMDDLCREELDLARAALTNP